MNIKQYIFLAFFLAFYSQLSAQNPLKEKQVKVAKSFVDSYNQQNYSKMKKHFFALAKLLPIKKGLKNEFEPRFSKLGKAKINSTESSSANNLVIELNYEKDITEKDFLSFSFNNENKIVGLYFKNPDFLYPKNNSKNTSELKASKIDSLMIHKFSNGFNGNVLIVDEGKEVYKKSFGFSNLDAKQLLNDSSIFELASCSKQFTGMAIMILSEQGKLNYSDTIQKYIPNLPYKNITIQNLLTHTSGLPDYMELVEKHWDKSKFVTNNDLVNLFKQYHPKPYFSPNEAFDYSNTGFALLSIIIEKASGLSYSEFLDQYIFKKIGMNHTRVYNTRRSKNETINSYAYGYVYSTEQKKYVLPDSLKEYKFVNYMDAITGDGTVNSTTTDIAIFSKALHENRLTHKSPLQHAYTSHKLKSGKDVDYAFGQFLCVNNTYEKLVYHGGSWPGYSTFIIHFIDKESSIIILSNNDGYNVAKLADQIAVILME